MSNKKVRKRVIQLCGNRSRQNFHTMFGCRQKVEKLGGPQILGSRGAPTLAKFFLRKNVFFQMLVRKNLFLGISSFYFIGGHPTPKFLTIFFFVPVFVFVPNFCYRSNFRSCFSFRSSFRSSINFRSNFRFRCDFFRILPARDICTVFELFEPPFAFQKCHHKWTKVHRFGESGGFPIFAPIAISPPFLNFGPQNFGVV